MLDETFGLGPMEMLLKDPSISEIMVNGPKNVFVEKSGKLVKTPVTFRDNKHLMQIIDRIVSRVGRRVDEVCPMVDARLAGRLACERDHPAAGARRPERDDPAVRLEPAEARGPAELQEPHARDGDAPRGRHEGEAEHHDLGRHRLG